MEQYPGQSQHLLLAAGQGTGPLAAAAGQVREEVHHPGHPPVHVGPVRTVDVGPHDQVLAYRHIGEHPAAAGELLDAQAGP